MKATFANFKHVIQGGMVIMSELGATGWYKLLVHPVCVGVGGDNVVNDGGYLCQIKHVI